MEVNRIDNIQQSFGRWPAQELYDLRRATKLCDQCMVIFDTSQPRCVLGKYGPAQRLTYEHHASVDNLLKSVEAGCRLCHILDKRWSRYSSAWRSREGRLLVERGDASFYFRDMVDWIVIGLQGSEQKNIGDGTVLLDLRLQDCTCVSCICSANYDPYPFHGIKLPLETF